MLEPMNMTASLAEILVKQAESMTPEQIQALQSERLAQLVSYAREHSPLLREKYSDLPENFTLTDIPPCTRDEAMARFDEWVCDPEVTRASVTEYTSNLENSHNLYLGRYKALMTSGTTGTPLFMVRDARHLHVNAALMKTRLFGGNKMRDAFANLPPWYKYAAIYADAGFHSTYLSFQGVKKSYEEAGFGDHILALPLHMSLDEIVAALNDFQPDVISGYPSHLRVLALQQQRGKLSISPAAIGCSAEKLTADNLQLIEETFGCPVVDNFCSTEAGEAAMLCRENRMHVNCDWIIFEPVDKDMQPVPPGVESDGVLITNLANTVQPIIRYFVSDKITLHHAPCACGLPLPYMTAEGRCEDTLEFLGKDGDMVPVPATQFITISMHIPGMDDVQFVQTGQTQLELRFTEAPGADRASIGKTLFAITRELLDREDLRHVEIGLHDEAPIRGKTGKLRNTLKNF